MARVIGSIAVLVLVSLLAYGTLAILAQNGIEPQLLVMAASGVAIGLSLLALLFGVDAWRRARASQNQVRTFALSVDAALRQAANGRMIEIADNAGALELIRRDIESLGARLPGDVDALPSLPRDRRGDVADRRTEPRLPMEEDEETTASGEPAQDATTDDAAASARTGAGSAATEKAPASKRGRRAADQTPAPEKARPDNATVEAAVEKALNDDRIEISLQPIIAVTRGTAAGFEVYAHLPVTDDRFWNIRRLARPVSTVDIGRFERLLLETAGGAARRRLGTTAEAMPMHVAVSEALLDGQHHQPVLDLLKEYPALSRSLVLSVPVQVAESAERYLQPIDALTGAGVRLASEGWSGTPESLDLLKRHAVDYVKLTADRLLDRARVRRGAPKGAALIEMAAQNDISVIATDVRTDEDAVSLVDLGVVLMRGEHFSGPKKLKAESAPVPGSAAAS